MKCVFVFVVVGRWRFVVRSSTEKSVAIIGKSDLPFKSKSKCDCETQRDSGQKAKLEKKKTRPDLCLWPKQ